MKNLFVDTNVLIDFLADRQPFSIGAAKLFNYALSNKIKIFVAAISYSNIYYILLRQSIPTKEAIKLLSKLCEMTEVVAVTEAVIQKALISDFRDFEDAIQYNCALNIADIQMIVTRNVKDYKKSIIPIMTTDEAVSFIALNN